MVGPEAYKEVASFWCQGGPVGVDVIVGPEDVPEEVAHLAPAVAGNFFCRAALVEEVLVFEEL